MDTESSRASFSSEEDLRPSSIDIDEQLERNTRSRIQSLLQRNDKAEIPWFIQTTSDPVPVTTADLRMTFLPERVPIIHELEEVPTPEPEEVPTIPESLHRQNTASRTHSMRVRSLAASLEALEVAEYRRTHRGTFSLHRDKITSHRGLRGRPTRRVSERSSSLRELDPTLLFCKAELSDAEAARRAAETKSNPKLAKLDRKASTLKQKIDHLKLRRDEAHAGNGFDSPQVKKLSMQVISISKRLAKVCRERYNMRSSNPL